MWAATGGEAAAGWRGEATEWEPAEGSDTSMLEPVAYRYMNDRSDGTNARATLFSQGVQQLGYKPPVTQVGDVHLPEDRLAITAARAVGQGTRLPFPRATPSSS